MRWVGGVVLDPQLAEAELLRQTIGSEQRCPAGGERPLRRRGHGQEIAVAPDRMRSGLDPAAKLSWIGRRSRCVGDLERTEAPLADVPRIERVRGSTFLTAQRLWRHI